MTRTSKVSEKDAHELLSWVVNAPVGEARALAFRSDGNDTVTVKQYLNSTMFATREFSPHDFKTIFGLPLRRHDDPQNSL